MAETKTKPGTESAPAFIKAIEDEGRRADAKTLVAMMTRVTGEKPKIWGGSIVGFGTYHYKYATGTEGDSALVGFAPRRGEFSIYLTGTYFPEQGNAREALLKRLGKHRMGKACLYVKRLDDIDIDVLEKLVEMSASALKAHYPSP
jgi:hypothetical protein